MCVCVHIYVNCNLIEEGVEVLALLQPPQAVDT